MIAAEESTVAVVFVSATSSPFPTMESRDPDARRARIMSAENFKARSCKHDLERIPESSSPWVAG